MCWEFYIMLFYKYCNLILRLDHDRTFELLFLETMYIINHIFQWVWGNVLKFYSSSIIAYILELAF